MITRLPSIAVMITSLSTTVIAMVDRKFAKQPHTPIVDLFYTIQLKAMSVIQK